MNERVIIDKTDMVELADEIRAKAGKTNSMNLKQLKNTVNEITVGSNVPEVEQATPSITVSSAGLITASATQEAGIVPAGTKSATKQLSTQAAKTVTPTKSTQTAVASGKYTTGAVKVAAIPSTYVQPSGTLTITENGTHNVKSYASVTVNVESGTSDWKLLWGTD